MTETTELTPVHKLVALSSQLDLHIAAHDGHAICEVCECVFLPTQHLPRVVPRSDNGDQPRFNPRRHEPQPRCADQRCNCHMLDVVDFDGVWGGGLAAVAARSFARYPEGTTILTINHATRWAYTAAAAARRQWVAMGYDGATLPGGPILERTAR